MKNQRGMALMLLVLAVMMTVGAALAMRMFAAGSAQSRRGNDTLNRMENVRRALVNYVMLNGRLPCPSDGAASTGLPVPGANNSCSNADGVVPWSTLGLNQSDALDGWSRAISYRVFAGNSGLTVADGASMSNCDRAPAAPVAPTPPFYLCSAAHTTSANPVSPIGFLSPTYRAGLTVSDSTLSSTVSQVGFVLISHGETGYGAWLTGGTRTPLPAVANTAEFANTQAGGTYYKSIPSSTTVLPDAISHFDDLLVYSTIADLIHQAGKDARLWTIQTPIVGGPAAVSLTPAVLTADPNVTFSGRASNVSLITLTAQPMPLIVSTGANYVIARNSTSGSATSIGVCPSPPATCNSTAAQVVYPEFLSFRLTTQTAEKVSFTFSNFTGAESFTLEFRFKDVVVGTVRTIVHGDTISGLQASTADKFDEVIIRPQGTTAFLIKTIRFCDKDNAC